MPAITNATTSGVNLQNVSANFPGVIEEIEEKAYVLLYESTLTPKLCKEVARGVKGSGIEIPYFNPTTFANSGFEMDEGVDYQTYTQLTNTSIHLSSKEFGIQSFLTDTVTESGAFDFKAEIARQQAIGVSKKVEDYFITQLNDFENTITATDSDGLSLVRIAAARTLLDSRLVTVPGDKSLMVHDFAWFYTATGQFNVGDAAYQSALPVYGEEVLRRWYVRTLFGDVHVFKNNYIPVTGDTNKVANSYMFVKDAVVYWVPRDYRLESERDASARGWEFTSTMRIGAKTAIPEWGVKIASKADTPAGATKAPEGGEGS